MNKVEVKYKGKSAFFYVTDPNDHIQKHWLAGNFYEAGKNGMLHYVYEHYRGWTWLDIGAHHGNHSIFFEKICGCIVYRFEPSPENHECLLYNLYANGLGEEDDEDEILECAIGAEDGFGKIIRGPEGNSGMTKIQLCKEEDAEVEIRTLDSFNYMFHKGENIALKIDAEGMGLDVLKGATECLRHVKPHIFIEAETTTEFNKIAEYLKGFGYKYSGRQFNATPTYLFLP